jgi:hypothetical protein
MRPEGSPEAVSGNELMFLVAVRGGVVQSPKSGSLPWFMMA